MAVNTFTQLVTARSEWQQSAAGYYATHLEVWSLKAFMPFVTPVHLEEWQLKGCLIMGDVEIVEQETLEPLQFRFLDDDHDARSETFRLDVSAI